MAILGQSAKLNVCYSVLVTIFPNLMFAKCTNPTEYSYYTIDSANLPKIVIMLLFSETQSSLLFELMRSQKYSPARSAVMLKIVRAFLRGVTKLTRSEYTTLALVLFV